MNSDVIIAGAKRGVVIGTRAMPCMWKTVIEFFDTSLNSITGNFGISDWLNLNTDWEVKSFVFDPKGDRWMLIAQRPCK